MRTQTYLTTAMTLLVLALLVVTGSPIAAQKRAKPEEKAEAVNLPAVIWRGPGDIAVLNLFYGAGGKEHAPDPHATYTFRKEVLHGTSPKFDVEDDHGVVWRVKVGQEPQAETAATRLLWAAGYFTDEDYYLDQLKVTGLPALHRGRDFVSSDGTVHRARLKRYDKSVKKLGDWDWFHNPFSGTRELNGLRVMMALVDNWDLAADNNSIYEGNGEQHYLVSDVGASFGKTGNYFARSKSTVRDYERSKFIDKSKSDFVDFVMHSRPFIFSVFDLSNYRSRTHMEGVTKHIPRADAQWLGRILSRLSEEQIRDAFRASGYTPEQVEGYTRTVRARIAELSAL